MARRVYRVEWERWLNVAISGVFTAALVFIADDGRQGPGSASSASRLIGYGLAAVAFVLLVRAFRLGIVSTGDEFEIRGLLHSRTFKAADVESFTMVRGQGVMTLNSGRAVRLWHVQMPNPSIFPRSRSAQVIVNELNRELHNRTPHGDRQA